MKRIILFLLFFQSYLFPQYSIQDHDLVKTTFLRAFNKDVILPYLHSEDETKVKAALLSISHSKDTSWVDEITQLPFKKYSTAITFALGQLPASEKSLQFLLDKISDTDNTVYLLEALGKISNKNAVNKILNYYNTDESKSLSGIPLFIYHVFNKGIIGIDTAEIIFINEIKNSANDDDKISSLFAFSRIGCNENNKKKIAQDLVDNFPFNINENEKQLEAEQFLFQFLKKIKYFPDDLSLLRSKVNSNNALIKIETARSACYLKFGNAIELEKYLSLLEDDNPNVVRAAAESLKELSLNETLDKYLKEFIEQKIKTLHNDLIKEELLLSYLRLYKPNFPSVINKFEKYISKSALYLTAAEDQQSNKAVEFLLQNYDREILSNKIRILNSLLTMHHADIRNKKINSLLLDALKENSAPLISISADGLDSIFIKNNSKILSEIINESIEKRKDDPDYLESLMSLRTLSEKINKDFSGEILNKLISSNVYSIRKYASDNLGLKMNREKDEGNFEELWSNSFLYKSAEIETKKGIFIIEFLPDFAPISVGNFVHLVKEKIYNGNIFHRVVPGFVIQGGDPTETGWGGPGYDIVSEFSWLNYNPAMVGMASAGKDTEGSQWFVTTGSYPHLDGRYSIFGKVIMGFETVNFIEQNDEIISIKLID